MSRVEHLETQVKSLSKDELKAFRDWFACYDAEAWDAQIESDVAKGKLQLQAERALRDHKSGQSKVL